MVTPLLGTAVTLPAKSVAQAANAILPTNAAKFATCLCMNVIVKNATITTATAVYPMIQSIVVRIVGQCV